MVPAIVAGLVSQGLSLLGNAVLAKGKDWVEEKTGVKLQENMSEDNILKLKQFEFEHEEELMRLRLEGDKLDFNFFQEEVKDRDSARDRDKAFINTGKRNYRADVMFILAVAMISALVYIVWRDDTVNEYAKGIFTLVLGRFLGYLDNIYNFEFGTTRSSKDKDETIKQLSGGSK